MALDIAGQRARVTLFPLSGPMWVFLALQAGDVLTTFIFRKMGVAEANPIAKFLMAHLGNLAGLLTVKLAAIYIGVACGMASHPVFVRGINVFYGVIVAINYLSICAALHH